jgi:hypothetical protein
MVDTLWFWENGIGIEDDYMLDHARNEFAYLMNAQLKFVSYERIRLNVGHKPA